MKHVHLVDIEQEEVYDPAAKDVKIRWLITKEDGAENFAMRLFDIGPGGYTPYHNHDFEHEVFVLEGTGILNVEEREESLKKGDVVLLPTNIKHQFLNHSEETLRFLCLIPYKD